MRTILLVVAFGALTFAACAPEGATEQLITGDFAQAKALAQKLDAKLFVAVDEKPS